MNWKPLEIINDIGIDFDNTVSNTSGYPEYIPQEPIDGAVESITHLKRLGYGIVIFTARHWSDKQNIKEYCQKYNIPFDSIICGKPLFKWMIDDRSIGFRGDWENIIKEIN